MKKKCSNCGLVNFPTAVSCSRCREALQLSDTKRPGRSRSFLWRAFTCAIVVVAALLGFYLSLLFSATPLSIDQKSTVRRAAAVLRARGFSKHAFLLDNITVYRSNDNWLNASVAKENAYAATNFPFEIMTLYSDFFTYPVDDVERAAILLHEAEHLRGRDEHDAYEFVWRHRSELGWTRQAYLGSPVWENVRKQTRDNVPELFNCPDRELGDCTE